jgi:hypothetical protein
VASIRPNCGGRLTLVLAALPQSHTLSDILVALVGPSNLTRKSPCRPTPSFKLRSIG